MKKASNQVVSRVNNRPDNRTIAHSFDKIAFGYNLWSSITESDALKKAFELCDIQDGMTILEAGVGTGQFLEWALQENRGGINLGIDLSWGMLTQAKKRVQNSQSKSFQLIQGDIMALPIQEYRCDIIISTFVFDLLPAEAHLPILSQMHKILNADGKLVLATMTETEHLTHKAWGWFASKFPAFFTYCRPIDIKPSLLEVNYTIELNETISQNSFPSEVILAEKNKTTDSLG